MGNIDTFLCETREHIKIDKRKTMNKKGYTLHLPIALKMSLPTQENELINIKIHQTHEETPTT